MFGKSDQCWLISLMCGQWAVLYGISYGLYCNCLSPTSFPYHSHNANCVDAFIVPPTGPNCHTRGPPTNFPQDGNGVPRGTAWLEPSCGSATLHPVQGKGVFILFIPVINRQENWGMCFVGGHGGSIGISLHLLVKRLPGDLMITRVAWPPCIALQYKERRYESNFSCSSAQ